MLRRRLYTLRSGMFAPPLGPPDLARRTSGLHDGPLFSGTKCPTKVYQRGLHKPRFERQSCRLAVGIELSGHSQRLQRRCDTPRRHHFQDDDADPGMVTPLPFPGFLDHSQGCTGCGIVAFKSAFCELEQEGLGRRDTTRDSAFADSHHLTENGLIRRFATTPSGTTGRIAALTLCKARRLWRPAISNTTILNIVFLLLAAALLVRFFRSGGRAMLTMMGGSPDGHH